MAHSQPSMPAVVELYRVKRFVRILGMVQSPPDFKDYPKVLNGFSDLVGTRSAVGLASLSSGIAPEVEAMVELHDGR